MFGRDVWREALDSRDRESAVVDAYRESLRAAGFFRHVTSTRILKPNAERAYFHLVYGTRHLKGLLEFRSVEKRFADEQERVRSEAKQRNRIETSGQQELFGSAEGSGSHLQQEWNLRIQAANDALRMELSRQRRIKYDDVLATLLERPLVWESDVKTLIDTMQRNGELKVEGLKPRERTPKLGGGHILVPSATLRR